MKLVIKDLGSYAKSYIKFFLTFIVDQQRANDLDNVDRFLLHLYQDTDANCIFAHH